MIEVPNFEAEATEETITGREKLDTEKAARKMGAWIRRELGVDVRIRDERPQHELQSGGAVVFSIDIENVGPETVAKIGAFANTVDAEFSVSRRADKVTLKKWHAKHPVYSDYFGSVNGWRNTAHPLA